MLSQEIKDSLDRRENTCSVFDFGSACDSVWRVKLKDKIGKIGVKGRMLIWFHSLIIHHFYVIKCENKISGYKQSRRGLLQAVVPSCEIKNIKAALFGDD
jgi:hypothetical protein